MKHIHPYNISVNIATPNRQPNIKPIAHRVTDLMAIMSVLHIDDFYKHGDIKYGVNSKALNLNLAFDKAIKSDVLACSLSGLVNMALYGNVHENTILKYLNALGNKAFKSLKIDSQFSDKKIYYSAENNLGSTPKAKLLLTDYFRHKEDWSYFEVVTGQASAKVISKHANKPIYEVINDRRLKLIEEGKLSEDSYFNQQLVNRYENVDAQWFIEVVSHIVKRDDNPELLLEDVGCRILSNGQLNTVLTAV